MSRKLIEKKNKVLIIEDDHDIRVCFRDILESCNFEICSATNGRDAFTLLNSSEDLPDLIISDLSMPIMDGNEFITKKNQVERLRDIPVLIISAHVQKVFSPDVAILPKPVDMSTFLNKVYEYVPQEFVG
jgi:CheY-like chemotaxis protein